MSINSISSQSSISGNGSLRAAEDPRIKNLKQKLSQLNNEKEKAEKAKNLDKVRELERKIQEIERRLEELRNKKAEKKESKNTGTESSFSHLRSSGNDIGNYLDESV